MVLNLLEEPGGASSFLGVKFVWGKFILGFLRVYVMEIQRCFTVGPWEIFTRQGEANKESYR